mgnify:CR=1 FL=1
MAEYAIADSGGRAILEQACASADRAAECAAIIAEQGAVISTKHGLKDHPFAATRDGCAWPCWPFAHKAGARRRAAATDRWEACLRGWMDAAAMSTKRKPISRPPRVQITPLAIRLFTGDGGNLLHPRTARPGRQSTG